MCSLESFIFVGHVGKPDTDILHYRAPPLEFLHGHKERERGFSMSSSSSIRVEGSLDCRHSALRVPFLSSSSLLPDFRHFHVVLAGMITWRGGNGHVVLAGMMAGKIMWGGGNDHVKGGNDHVKRRAHSRWGYSRTWYFNYFSSFLISPLISRDFSLVFSSLSSQKNKSV